MCVRPVTAVGHCDAIRQDKKTETETPDDRFVTVNLPHPEANAPPWRLFTRFPQDRTCPYDCNS